MTTIHGSGHIHRKPINKLHLGYIGLPDTIEGITKPIATEGKFHQVHYLLYEFRGCDTG